MRQQVMQPREVIIGVGSYLDARSQVVGHHGCTRGKSSRPARRGELTWYCPSRLRRLAIVIAREWPSPYAVTMVMSVHTSTRTFTFLTDVLLGGGSAASPRGFRSSWPSDWPMKYALTSRVDRPDPCVLPGSSVPTLRSAPRPQVSM